MVVFTILKSGRCSIVVLVDINDDGDQAVYTEARSTPAVVVLCFCCSVNTSSLLLTASCVQQELHAGAKIIYFRNAERFCTCAVGCVFFYQNFLVI